MILVINENRVGFYEALFIAHELNWVKGAFSKSTTFSDKCIQKLESQIKF